MKIVLSIILVILISFLIGLINHNLSPDPERQLHKIQIMLSPDGLPEDNLPENPLDIPESQWEDEKIQQIMALRALDYFYSKGITFEELKTEREIKNKGITLGGWAHPWKLHFLINELNDEEVRLVYDLKVSVLASSWQAYGAREEKITGWIARVKPPVELYEGEEDHYASQSDIYSAYKSGELRLVKTKNIKYPKDKYTSIAMAEVLERNIDPALSDYEKLFKISSLTRAIDFQKILRKLVYPAVKLSYHTKGSAVDLKLTNKFRKDWNAYLEAKPVNSEKTRLDLINELYFSGTLPTLNNLAENGVIEKDYPLYAAYLAIMNTVEKMPVDVVDEIPFFIQFEDETERKILGINSVLHIQLREGELEN